MIGEECGLLKWICCRFFPAQTYKILRETLCKTVNTVSGINIVVFVWRKAMRFGKICCLHHQDKSLRLFFTVNESSMFSWNVGTPSAKLHGVTCQQTVKVKVFLSVAWRCGGGVELHLLVTSALDGSEWPDLRPGHFTLGTQIRYRSNRWLGGNRGQFERLTGA